MSVFKHFAQKNAAVTLCDRAEPLDFSSRRQPENEVIMLDRCRKLISGFSDSTLVNPVSQRVAIYG
ncbi:MAG: hypothetical protein MUE44_20505 [Oscillatoriaceae cyanobacterium Prado104]|jgi:hypothetical protein|nr:hypothetical protein [Oscillatoriaceae cyanobacterium Prado104]